MPTKDLHVLGVAMLYAKRVDFPQPSPPVDDVDAESAAMGQWLDRVLDHAEAHPSEAAKRLGAAIVKIMDTPEAE